MQVSSINNYNLCAPKKAIQNNKSASTPNVQQNVAFTSQDANNKFMKAARNAGVAMIFLLPATSAMTSCDRWEDYGYAKAEAHAIGGPGSIVDTTICIHPTDTIIKWYYDFNRPLPLDSLFNDFQNWDIDGTEGDKNDSTAKRNIIHYEGTRDWEYDSREIGDINLLEANNDPKILIYDTEVLDYKGNHESYGKRVFRIPTGSFTITKEDGTVLRSPKGLFVEEYASDADEKNASIYDCSLKTRAFVSTAGDTLNVARRKGTNEFVETGKVAKGYLGANSVLLRNLIGEYSTDDHYIDFKVDAITDEELRAKYVYEKDAATE
jgi:hypothetical protein